MLFVGMVFFALATSLRATDTVGSVCVPEIPKGESWKGNDTGAMEQSVFTVQIDKFTPVLISTNSCGVFTNLSLTDAHLVKIQLDGKPLTSFRFTFHERAERLRLWYNPFYGTWSLTDLRPRQTCP